MKSVYMLMHQRKPNLEALVKSVVEAFQSVGISVTAETWLREQMGMQAEQLFGAYTPEQCDAVIAVGGDGTLLRANALAVEYGLPVLGINVGRVGFLTEIELHQVTMACEFLARDAYTLEERMLLEARVGERMVLALNDVVISRGGYSRLISINARVNGELIGHYIADGLIVSTPTGSTGYSLSAGGPLVCPEVECMLLTPVCAHSLQHRPVVTSAAQIIEIHLDEEYSAIVSIDGQEPLSLDSSQQLTITRSKRKARFIRLEPRSFFSKIRIKLAEWSC